MKQLLLILLIFCLGNCSDSPNKRTCVDYPSRVYPLKMDSVDSGILLNANGMVATEDYLIISNANTDTIFNVFDVENLSHLYGGMVYGQGGNDMLPFRWMRLLEGNRFYTVGFGVPIITKIETGNTLGICERKNIEWEKDICQNIYLLNDERILIQPGKKMGEWSLYDINGGKTFDMPEFPFKDCEPECDMINTFRNRSVNVAVNKIKERIAFFYGKIPYVQFFDFDGKILFESCVGSDIPNPAKFFNNDVMYYVGCSYTDEFIVMKYIPDKMKEGVTCFQVWDWEGNMLSLFEIDAKINLFTISCDGKTMYAAKNDNDNIFICDLSSVFVY